MTAFLKTNVVWISSSLLLLAASAVGQVRIQCHPGLDVPQERVSLLFDITWRVVAEEFRLADHSKLQAPVTLVVGESRDGVEGDETNQVFTIYMSRWDETMFATSVSRIALQHLLSQDRKAHLVRESLRRANLISPISVKDLHGRDNRNRNQPPPPTSWRSRNDRPREK